MKQNKPVLIAVAGFILILMTISCRKTDMPKPAACSIVRLTTEHSVFTYAYNSAGKLSQIVHGEDTSFFSYYGNNITRIDNISGVFGIRTSVTLNPNGLASNARVEANTDGTIWVNYFYEYDGTELKKQTTTSSAGAQPTVVVFSWKDGNLTEINSGPSVSRLEYFTDKKAMNGDYFELANLQAGYEIFRTKNSPKSFSTTGTATTNFGYSYDADGKIVSVTLLTGADVEVFNYQYKCQ